MASALPWAAPASHLNLLNCSACRPALLCSPFSHAPNFLRTYHRRSFLSRVRRISPPLCRILRHQEVRHLSRSIVGRSNLWCGELGLGFQPLGWAKGGKLSFSVESSNKNVNADTDKESEVVSHPVLENLRVIGRDDEVEDEDSDDEEEDGIYYAEDEEEDEFSDIDGEFEDNEEDAEVGVVLNVASEGGKKNRKDRERLKELCAKVQASGERTVTARDIAELYDFPFDKFQVCIRCIRTPGLYLI